ncbi:MAG: TIGR03619 family F420-dependent LLM class oxidoreductase [Pseudomonadales bacterium]
MTDIKLILNMSENWTIWNPSDTRTQIAAAVQAEKAGFDGVMFSEHIVLGHGSNANGLPVNIREYAIPGNQEPDYPWPNSLVLMSGVAAVTNRIRIIGAAVLASLRHPLLLAKELGTLDQLAEGRLVVLPSVSWHQAEYEALGVPFERRGDILDEQIEVMRAVWAKSPVSHHGEFFDFDDVWLEPKAHRTEGPTLWFGGSSINPRLMRRLIKYGSGIMNLGPLPPAATERIAAELDQAGRHISEIEMVSAIVGRFTGPDSIADLDAALTRLGPRIDAGFTTFAIKPCQFIDEATLLPEFLEEVFSKANAIAANH